MDYPKTDMLLERTLLPPEGSCASGTLSLWFQAFLEDKACSVKLALAMNSFL